MKEGKKERKKETKKQIKKERERERRKERWNRYFARPEKSEGNKGSGDNCMCPVEEPKCRINT